MYLSRFAFNLCYEPLKVVRAMLGQFQFNGMFQASIQSYESKTWLVIFFFLTIFLKFIYFFLGLIMTPKLSPPNNIIKSSESFRR